MKRFSLFILGGFTVLLTSCLGKFVESDVDKTFKENETSILEYASKNSLNLEKQNNTGIYYTITKPNSIGTVSTTQFEFNIAYTLKTLGGVTIDTKLAKDSVILNTYLTNVFEGFLYSLLILKEGEKGTFFIPSYLAYGTTPPTNVQKNEVIVAEIEILDLISEDEKIDNYIKKKKFIVTEKTATGLRFIKDSTTTGDILKSGDIVKVKYNGMFINETSFDSGEFDYTVGSGSTIKGFSEGVEKLKKGEKARIIFPSTLGYGTTGNTKIPPYTPLMFIVEIKLVNGK